MTNKEIISLLLILAILLPPANSYGQMQQMMELQKKQEQPETPAAPEPSSPKKMEEQAKFYLQKIGPGGIPSERLPEAKRPPSPPPPEPEKASTAAPRQSEETSAAEKRAEEYGLALKQFGYSFFYKPPETFLPVQTVPVGPDYIIGPEDTVRIVLWGSVSGEYSVTVDRNGNLTIPKIGVVHVSGLNYTQLRQVMEKEFARQYTNFQMNITLDNLRTIQIFMVGQARFPGTYAVSSLSTLISALFAAGGPSKSGSMRNIQVRRGKKVVVSFDMYDFLLHGDKSKDIRLQAGDVIFIQPIGPLAAIGSPTQQALTQQAPTVGGPVKIPAIFELKNEKTLMDLLHLAGGVADTAFKGRVQILRIKDRREMVMFEDDLGKVLTSNLNIPLIDGDMVKIFPVPGVVETRVRVAGAVKVTGEFGLRPNMRIKDLIEYTGGLMKYANTNEAEITRVTITQQGPETSRIYINLRAAMAGNPKDNIVLQPDDYLFVRAVPDWDLYTMAKIEGEVKYPGTYAIKKGETISSLLSRAGGFTDRAYVKGAFFTRVSVKDTQQKQLKQAIDRIETEMFAISSQKAQTEMEPEEAKRQQLYITQQRQLLAKLREIVPLGRIVIRFDDPERLRGTPNDIELQEGDSIVIPQIQQSVNVLGAVVGPTAVVYDPNLRVKGYIVRAGGASKYADVNGTYVLKVNGIVLSRRSFGWFGGPALGPTSDYQLGSFDSMQLDPGDTIIVPEELERIAWLKEIKDIAAILGNIALTAGVVLIGLK
jgi:polysaccharide biosynthesis/export protein